jgi:hypothetical protein
MAVVVLEGRVEGVEVAAADWGALDGRVEVASLEKAVTAAKRRTARGGYSEHAPHPRSINEPVPRVCVTIHIHPAFTSQSGYALTSVRVVGRGDPGGRRRGCTTRRPTRGTWLRSWRRRPRGSVTWRPLRSAGRWWLTAALRGTRRRAAGRGAAGKRAAAGKLAAG